jgi:protein involved in polysaccharide export with SLBB domain
MVLLLLTFGCASQQPRAGIQERLLRPGDCLVITVTTPQTPELRLVIDPAGNISMPFLGEFHVAGLTLRQAGASIKAGYRTEALPRPEVAVSICP